MIPVVSPSSSAVLLERAHALSGLTLEAIAHCYRVPTHNIHKGWIGKLLEIALGADAHSRPEPDFMHLGIELKTVPINQQGYPRESTFVCAIPGSPDSQWQGSSVQRKLARVLWIPILTAANLPLLQRRVSAPLLWSPSPTETALLQEDWEELSELMMLGKASELTACHGQALQIRPKAAHSHILRQDIDSNSEPNFIIPRGFYLRAEFTAQIIRYHYWW